MKGLYIPYLTEAVMIGTVLLAIVAVGQLVMKVLEYKLAKNQQEHQQRMDKENLEIAKRKQEVEERNQTLQERKLEEELKEKREKKKKKKRK
ncbi:hypothetical protein [Thermoflavimicrobium daqui]|jgi:hypothetical protein|uniref:Uncharacterized protein n=1 Tax=Thermoflavimicrobium daqui TaxID=2137476 RepID=A0A364K1U2_9BACL|nr:hypothetical protein [Thermoflavimicrobium daqui]RAL21996.1 hypothetical protein DL897_15555 [Thermoflavimicrobium daqui]